MPLTNLTFAKNPQFAAPRSYWRGLLIGYGPSATVSLAANIVHVHEPLGADYVDTYITIDPRFLPWSSNRWTLDHILTDVYSSIDGGPPLYFAGIIDCGLMTPSPKWGIGLTFSGATDHYNIFFPDAPAGYWLPQLP